MKPATDKEVLDSYLRLVDNTARKYGYADIHSYPPITHLKYVIEGQTFRLAELTGLLRELQWAGQFDGSVHCPCCNQGVQKGHKEDCRLFKALK